MTCYKLGNLAPDIHESAFIAAEATIIGQATLCENTSVWPGAVIRADNEPIVIGKGSNVQEGAVLHNDPGCPVHIGENVTIGHQAMLHGCTVEDGALIGIQAVVLNRAVIGKDSLVGAGAVVTEGKVFPERSLILGAPAKLVRTLSDEDVAGMRRNTQTYIDRAARYKKDLVAL
ncbi:gamma carbonic anhydrase family protein [Parapusillimonas granuli]|uniref:Gamma carbonic anhydrase family protein n=1 Tax=Parapusillimonas granuli TaxID=380911 RepID=A0A853FV40_9BURK|nr:gamma carbonic anhydrase family protein [Parapusillimonas granuli]MBB5215498.1 carbonic anhydrase/acetyltransferase-like protein (isoleucine patch superfamily) [Parapusillimonas granuli]MEB2400335.1 gamma carbonic anhydrase family protein [Alcaligenaceae bacterium]NYT49835.1 gamma carbonic anhydrase family protein [Parapusillimonas granuli]